MPKQSIPQKVITVWPFRWLRYGSVASIAETGHRISAKLGESRWAGLSLIYDWQSDEIKIISGIYVSSSYPQRMSVTRISALIGGEWKEAFVAFNIHGWFAEKFEPGIWCDKLKAMVAVIE